MTLPSPPSLPSLSPSEVGSILDACPLPSVVIRPDFTIVAANCAYAAAYRGRGAQIVGSRCYEIAHGRDVPCAVAGARCPVDGWQAGARCLAVTHEHQTQMGSRTEEVTAYPVADERGRTTMFLEVVQTRAVQPSPDPIAVGHAPAFERVRALIDRVARTDTPVLLLGESGTGKELAAAAIHAQSDRRDGRLVPLDCSSVPETLFESELLGYEKGAFTGAAHAKRGLVETATGGTLFLDEIGDVPLPLQVKLLRLIETGVYRRVGSTEPRRASFRLVCATHRDLTAMVQAGAFRNDLYYRISVFPIRLPPLRERLSDVPALAAHLLERIAPGRRLRLDPDALAILTRHTFPGNVRELLNILHRAALLADGDAIRPEHLPVPSRAADEAADAPAPPFPVADRVLPLHEAERRYLRWALGRFPNARGELATLLGISERTLFRKLSALRIAGDGEVADGTGPRLPERDFPSGRALDSARCLLGTDG